ncbi:uncharacterized protein LOC126838089 isoform X2 [Adelges cooleyi]|uniref:uncharacterized protein LOC126838089 isoform X2 n=1 Tax=Adelges cooleyi TaxID=133065 RepID=UPI00217F4CE2|nr:uncharacterized protein LOC126838089 isoform X2 [Adelges cooleyi]
MKLLGILISFALVGHVLATKYDKYVQEVLITNKQIKRAKNFMPRIIKNLVENVDKYQMEAIAFMVGVPENIDCALQAPDNESCSDGFSQNNIPDLNIYPSTDSEEDSDNPDSKHKIIIHFEVKLKYQKMMQSAISAGTDPNQIESLDLNHPPNDPEKGRVEAPKVKLENLASLLEERRQHTSAAQRNKIIHAQSVLTFLGSERRKLTLEAITSLIRQNDPLFKNLKMMCRLVGAFHTIKDPQAYIHYADVDGHFCVIIDIMYIEAHVYKFFGGVFWKVEPDRFNPAQLWTFLSEL